MKYYLHIKNTQKAFTLIELLVVISIIGLLSSIVLAAMVNARSSSKNAAIEREVIELRNALELTKNTDGSYSKMTSLLLQSGSGLASTTDTVSVGIIGNLVNQTPSTSGFATCLTPSPCAFPITTTVSSNVSLAIIDNNTNNPTDYAIYAMLGPVVGSSGYFCADSSGKTSYQNSGGPGVTNSWWINNTGANLPTTAGKCK